MITIIIIQRTLRVRTQSVKIFDFECSIRGSKSKILSSQIPDLNWKPSVYKTDALPIVLIWQCPFLFKRFAFRCPQRGTQGSAFGIEASFGAPDGALNNKSI